VRRPSGTLGAILEARAAHHHTHHTFEFLRHRWAHSAANGYLPHHNATGTPIPGYAYLTWWFNATR
jgi:hypothetical protein